MSSRVSFFLLMTSLFTTGMKLGAQQGNTFYLMHDVPQSNLLNPAVQIPCKYFVGLPFLGAFHVNYSNTAFTYRDLAPGETWNIEGVLDQMHRRDLYTGELILSPVSLGYRHKSLYFTFAISERMLAYQTVPGDLVEMLVHGNGPFIGETAKFNGFRPGAFHGRDYAIGISKVVDPYLTLGMRAKVLFGKANFTAGHTRVNLSTAADNFSLMMHADYTLNSSFPYTLTYDTDGNIDGIEFEPGDIDPVQYMLNRGNPGFGLDFGLIYKYDENITISASVLDVGIIRWRTNLNNIRGEGSYNYNGADLNSQLVFSAFVNEAIDSILNSLELTTSQEPYTYVLPAQIYLGASYQYSEKIAFGVVNRNLLFRSKIHSSFTVSARADLAERFLATVSWSYLNNSLKNLGAGFAYHGKGFQLHAVTDNFLGFFYPFNTRSMNLRFGVNLMLGCPRNKRERLQEEAYSRLPSGNCPYPEKPEKKRKQRIKAAQKRNRK